MAHNDSAASVPRGLTEAEALARGQRGLANDVPFRTTRSYLQILRRNALTFINITLFGISLVLILLGLWGDALATAGLVFLNVVVGVYQEGRAKHRLEQIALLTRPKALVRRDGQERQLDPAEVVLGDLLLVHPGDQFVVDGQVVGGGPIEVDESLLSGEAERIRKDRGDPVYSGSYCVTGSALYEAQKVGPDSLVNQLTARARAFRQIKTPLQREIDRIIRIMVLIAAQLGLLLAISFVIQGVPLVEWVRDAAVLVALVPQGLFFMTTVAYAMGMLRVAGRGALIQQANAVESISHVDLLCLDKTGTLTTNRILLEGIHPLAEVKDAQLRHILGEYAASSPGGSQTTTAIWQAFGGEAYPLRDAVPFSSERKWSALAWDGEQRPGAYILGAPEVLAPRLAPDSAQALAIDQWTQQGLRVLLFAHHPKAGALHDNSGQPQLPDELTPLTLLTFRDELRPRVRETLQGFRELGIELRVISGDHPDTVAALSRQVGLAQDQASLSGLELQAIEEDQWLEVARGTTVFGRISPHQKEKLVRLFRAQGRYVAMIGDGVNDVLSLKQADLGVAMESGSPATRGVADIVLLDDSFASLPIAFREGQRIVRGMEDVMRLLLTRTFYVLLLIVLTSIVGVPFPVTPKHNSILALLTVGIPILALAAWARPGSAASNLLRATGHFVLPAASTIAVVATAVYLAYFGATGSLALAQTALTVTTVFCGLLLIPFVEPPTTWWEGGDELSGDWRPSALALGMLALFAIVMSVPSLRTGFELVPLRWRDYLILTAAAGTWTLVLRWLWRTRLLSRLVALQPAPRKE